MYRVCTNYQIHYLTSLCDVLCLMNRNQIFNTAPSHHPDGHRPARAWLRDSCLPAACFAWWAQHGAYKIEARGNVESEKRERNASLRSANVAPMKLNAPKTITLLLIANETTNLQRLQTFSRFALFGFLFTWFVRAKRATFGFFKVLSCSWILVGRVSLSEE